MESSSWRTNYWLKNSNRHLFSEEPNTRPPPQSKFKLSRDFNEYPRSMLKWYSRIVACQVQHHRQRSGKQQQQRRWWQGTSWWQCCWTNVSSSSEDQRYVWWLYIVAFERYLVSPIGLGQIRVRPQEDDMKSHSSYLSRLRIQKPLLILAAS